MNKLVYVVLSAVLAGCAGSTAPTPAAAPGGSSQTASVAKPDKAKTTAHLNNHVKYPASRDAILAACADTPEFSAGEKKWLADSLPAGDYKNADDVLRALPF